MHSVLSAKRLPLGNVAPGEGVGLQIYSSSETALSLAVIFMSKNHSKSPDYITLLFYFDESYVPAHALLPLHNLNYQSYKTTQ